MNDETVPPDADNYWQEIFAKRLECAMSFIPQPIVESLGKLSDTEADAMCKWLDGDEMACDAITEVLVKSHPELVKKWEEQEHSLPKANTEVKP